MPDRRHGDYRGLNLPSKTLNAMEQHERKQDSQTRAQERLEKKMAARRRKLEGQKERDVTSEPTLPAVEAPQSPVARFWEFLGSIRGPERF